VPLQDALFYSPTVNGVLSINLNKLKSIIQPKKNSSIVIMLLMPINIGEKQFYIVIPYAKPV
jgi:hypothetical protein